MHKQKIKDKYLKKFGEPSTLDELGHYCINVINDTIKNESRVIGFAWEIEYKNSISNTHSCPIDGVENFRCREELPRGYPGFKGRVWIRYSHSLRSFSSDPFPQTLTYPGTGGGGAYDGLWKSICAAHYAMRTCKYTKEYNEPVCCSWDYKIFLSDWPLISEFIQHELLMNTLTDKTSKIKHKFVWEDEETKLADEKFMELYLKGK
jgi:hypothetical protein